jgi:hypothetical protein
MHGEKVFEDHGTSRTYTREGKLRAIENANKLLISKTNE